MLIGLHDGDSNNFPNLALMKISAWHKSLGDDVEWFNPLLSYDKVYSSKVFTFTPDSLYLPPDTIKGGTGYGLYDELPPNVDAMFPDYSIYPPLRLCDRIPDTRLHSLLPLVHRSPKRGQHPPLLRLAGNQTERQPGHCFHG